MWVQILDLEYQIFYSSRNLGEWPTAVLIPRVLPVVQSPDSFTKNLSILPWTVEEPGGNYHPPFGASGLQREISSLPNNWGKSRKEEKQNEQEKIWKCMTACREKNLNQDRKEIAFPPTSPKRQKFSENQAAGLLGKVRFCSRTWHCGLFTRFNHNPSQIPNFTQSRGVFIADFKTIMASRRI